jgi:GntR family transcriptional regulator
MPFEHAYEAVAASLRESVLSGAFPPSRRLPTDAEVSATFGVSRQTVRQAFNQLVDEGLVYRVRGRGSFALAAPTGDKYLRSFGSVDDLMALSEDTELEVLEPFANVVDIAAAGRLRLPTDEVAVGVFRRLHASVPFAQTRTYLPPELAGRIADDPRIAAAGARSATTIIALIEEASDHPLAGAYQSITASIADSETAESIGAEPGEAMLMIDRSYFDAQGTMVELAISAFNVRRYSYRLELRRRVR